MIDIQKLTIGVRPALKVFRLHTLGGSLVDSLLAARGSTKPLAPDYFHTIGTNVEKGAYRLASEDNSNVLTMQPADVIFTKDAYDLESSIDLGEFLREFDAIWKVLDETLHFRDVRRIGIVAETRIWGKSAHRSLFHRLMNLDIPNPFKLNLRFEERRQTKEGLAPDLEKSDYVNIIHSYYASSLDTEHPEDDAVNANLDVQRYYMPWLTSDVPRSAAQVSRTFEREFARLDKILKEIEGYPP
ncbi:MAG: hypothetical protein RIC56_03035 [Pseudomonadales bacterium]